MAKSKKKGKLPLILGMVALLLIAGGVATTAVLGIINIPGLTPKKQTAKLYGEGNELYGEGSQLAQNTPDAQDTDDDPYEQENRLQISLDPPQKNNTPPPAAKEEPTVDPQLGAKKIARIWNEIKPDKLAPITDEYKEEDLAAILVNMDSGQVGKLLAALEPKRAARVSQRMQSIGSVVPSPPSS